MRLFFTWAVLVFLCINSDQVFGQFNLGIHGGATIASMAPSLANSTAILDGYNYSYSKSLSGYYVGLFTRLKLDKYLSLLLDCSYAQNGYQTYSNESVSSGGTGAIHYLDYTHIYFIEPEAILEYGLSLGTGKMSLGMGLNIAIPVSGQEQLQYNFHPSLGTNKDTIVYNNNVSRKISVGIVGALRYEFNFGLFFEILYKYQFKAQPYYNLGRVETSSSLNLSVFELGTGFTFQFKKKGE